METDPVTGGASFHLTGAYVVAWILTAVASFAYHASLEGGPRAATIGKRALNITVRDASGLGPIGYARALVRIAGTVLWGLLFLPGSSLRGDRCGTTVAGPCPAFGPPLVGRHVLDGPRGRPERR